MNSPTFCLETPSILTHRRKPALRRHCPGGLLRKLYLCNYEVPVYRLPTSPFPAPESVISRHCLAWCGNDVAAPPAPCRWWLRHSPAQRRAEAEAVLGRVVVGGLAARALDASWSLPEALSREEPDLGFLFELEQALAQRERKRAEAPP